MTSELARAKGKGRAARQGRAPAAAAMLLALGSGVAMAGGPTAPAPGALPSGGTVAAGQVAISQPTAGQMTIDQGTSQAIINWNSFNIGSQASVRFNQPSSASSTLNRVLSSDPSQIYGNLSANGQVILVNPNGIVVGPTGTVNTAGAILSTLALSDSDYLAGKRTFQRNGSTASVVNEGHISTQGGYTALIGARVENDGQIVAPGGTVALGAGETVSLPLDADGQVTLKVSPATVDAVVQNGPAGSIVAAGGRVYLSSAAVNGVLARTLDAGSIDASGVGSGDGGHVKVWSSQDTELTGTIAARGGEQGGNGGLVEVSSEGAEIYDPAAPIDTRAPHGAWGTILLDPGTITICHAGSGAACSVTGANNDTTVTQVTGDASTTDTDTISDGTLATALSGGNVALTASTAINDDSTVSVTTSAGGSLTLTAPTINLSGSYGVNGGLVVSNTDTASVISGVISGAGGLTQNGAGTLTLTGANTYSGATTVSAGTLAVGGGTTNNGLSSNTSGVAISSGATFYLNYATAAQPPFSKFTGAGTLTLNSAQPVNGSANWTPTGGQYMGQTAAASLPSTFTGTLSLLNGRIDVANPTAFGGAASVNVGNGGQILFFDNTYNDTAYTYTQNLTLNGGGWGGDGTRGGSLRAGAEAVTLTGNIYLAGSTTLLNHGGTVNSGSLAFTGPIADLGGVAGSANTLTIDDATGDGVTFSGANTFADGVSVNAGTLRIGGAGTLGAGSYAGAIALSSGTKLDYASSANQTLSGVISGAGALQQDGGSLILTGANTYSGSTTLNAGTFEIGGAGTLGAGSYAGAIALSSGTKLDYASSANQTLSGVVSGAGALQQDGGSLILTGADTYSGGTALNAGTLQIGDGTGTSGTASVSGAITDNSHLVYDYGSAAASTISNGISGSGDLAATSGNGLTISGAVSLTGSTSNVLLAAGAGRAAAAPALSPTNTSVTGGDVTLSAAVATATGAHVTIYSGNYNTAALLGEITVGGASPASSAVTKTYATATPATPTSQTANTVYFYYRVSPQLQFAGMTANNKVYDGTTAATMNSTGATATGYVDGDSGSVNTSGVTGAFASQNAGTGIAVSLSSVSNADSVTYGSAASSSRGYTPLTTLAANITPAPLTVSGETASNKVYDGTPTATLTGGSLVGIVGSDSVTLAQAGAFAQSNVGTGLGVTAADTLGGASASNYTLTQPTGLTASITAAPLTVTAASNTKTYDATAAAAATPTITSGTLYGIDAATLAETYGTSAVGTALTLTPTATFTSGSASNYAISYISSSTGVITAASLTVTAASNTKTYDATTAAVATPTITSGTLYGSDAATLAESYGTSSVGAGLTLTPTATFTSGSASNYAISYASNNTGVITAAPLTVTAASNTKTYDATTAAVAIPTITSGTLYGSDAATLAESYGTSSVGTGLRLTPTATFTSGSASNYAISYISSSTGVITAAPLTVTAASNTKTYDATTAAAATPTITSGTLYGSDAAALTESYGASAVGTGLTLMPTANFTSGSASNYAISYASNSAGVITAAPITVTAASNTKTYDATTAAAATPTITSGTLYGSDAATLTESYGTSSVGTGLTLTPTATFTSGSASNYAISYASNSTGAITAAPITVTAASNSKTYDATTAAAATPTITSGTLYGSDAARLAESYGTSAVGTALTLTPTATFTSGSASNYAITYANSSTGVITAKPLTVSGETANNKVYDGTTTGTLAGGTLVGVITGDTVTLTQAGAFSQSNVGTGLAVTASDVLGGTSAGNYTLTQPTGLSANITPAPLTITAASNTKTYDATTSAVAIPTITSGTLYGSDAATLTESYGTSAVGTGLTLTPTATFTRGAASNYAISYANTSTGVINPAPLTVSGETASNKVYDGTTTAMLTGGSLVGVLSGDSVTLAMQAGTFVQSNAGTGLAVTAADTLGGTSAGNYTLTQPMGLTANISPAPLTVAGETANNKVYDGTTAATLAGGSLVGVLSGDSVTLATQAGTFAQSNVGTGLAVTTADVLGGASAGNYTLTQPTGLTADITPAPLTVTAASNTKTYDGTTSAAAIPTITGGTLYGSDAATLAESYGTSAVGTGLALTPTATFTSGSASNYTITYADDTAGVINPAATGVTNPAAQPPGLATTVNSTSETATTASGTDAAFNPGAVGGPPSYSGGIAPTLVTDMTALAGGGVSAASSESSEVMVVWPTGEVTRYAEDPAPSGDYRSVAPKGAVPGNHGSLLCSRSAAGSTTVVNCH